MEHGEFERQSRAALEGSLEHLDARVRSRLTQARHAALDELGRASRQGAWWREASGHRAWWRQTVPVAAFGAAAMLALSFWTLRPDGAGVPATSLQGIVVADGEDLDFVLGEDLFDAALFADAAMPAAALMPPESPAVNERTNWANPSGG